MGYFVEYRRGSGKGRVCRGEGEECQGEKKREIGNDRQGWRESRE